MFTTLHLFLIWRILKRWKRVHRRQPEPEPFKVHTSR